jgi:hypothetical protein
VVVEGVPSVAVEVVVVVRWEGDVRVERWEGA